MIFYIATDQDGLKHALTVATEAKAIDKNFVEVDQPNDKGAIKQLLQESFDHIHQLEKQIRSLEHDRSIAHVTITETHEKVEEIIDELQSTQSTSAQSSPVASLPDTWQQSIAAQMEVDRIEDFILNTASVAQCENIFSCLGNRFAEMAQKITKLETTQSS